MVKAIFFDFDGVLTTESSASYTVCHYLSETLALNFEPLLRSYRAEQHRILVGQESVAEFWPRVCTAYGAQISTKALFEAFAHVPVNDAMFAFIRELKSQYTIGIITDNGKERFGIVQKKLKLTSLFDPIICSSDIQAMKDSSPIFDTAIQAVRLQPEEVLFIDNSAQNLRVPNELGWKTYLYDHEKNDIAALKKQLQSWGIVFTGLV